ncbi:MAG: PAS domain-containing sensor histidine kinase [Deltaproteobacteria bacterium]|nr:PAS domain-containing sensor histidine kinase [Deltaproteobacteria bacterium]
MRGCDVEERSDQRGELHRRLVWLTFFRLAVVLVLFAASVIWGSSKELTDPVSYQLIGVCTAGFLATLFFAVLLRWGRWLTGIAYAEITFDALLAMALVYLTGGSNAFSFVFILAVVNAALVLSQRGAILAASLSSLLFAALRVGLNERWLMPPAPYLEEPPTPTAALIFTIFVNLGAFFLMAALASYLADQIRKKSEQLTARELDFEALAELHSAMLASISSGIATADPSGRLLFVNRAGWEICGPWQNRQASTVVELLPGLALPAAGSPAVRQELEIAGRDGERRFLGLTVSPLHGGGAFAGGHVIVFQDLTELRRLELDARRNERLASIGKLAAGLAHELRNPLASMSGAVQMLTSNKADDPDEQRLGDIVVSETERLNRLVTDFLGFARPSPSRPLRLELAEAVGQTLDIVAHGPKFEGVKLERALEPVEVVADAAQLRQVVWNVAVNAAEAMGGKGTLKVSLHREGEEALLTMEDSGPGLPREVMAQLFDPFFTTKAQGTGLGLATVHALVEAHRGMVQAENREQGGARFTVRLPVAPPAPAADDARDSPGVPVAREVAG